MDIWRNKQKITFNDVDASGGITPFALFNYFQDAAESHAEIIGVGREAMESRKQLWVLSRISVFIEKRAKLDQEVLIQSWPRGFDRLFCVRDYTLADLSNNIIVRARSGWLVLDAEKHRPLRPQSLELSLPENKNLDALPFLLPALAARDELRKTSERTALYSDIDFNAHVNNARYVQWIQDISDADSLKNAHEIRIDINYLNEIKQNDILDIFTAHIEQEKDALLADAGFALAIEGRKRDNNEAAFRAELRMN
ncbi:MAG: acyl-ACP thioesterase [Spirochaetaceae bacterium]|jgi:acyl-ACP thioesterase|nr:acyl-ACP thioesterase [Spirochaetaceae bacterium]